ncbi:MAG: energy transducer TonB [Verrucomicrobia bacterium]|nr:energy transducer TonB [Verrucomicrobiota bacterium]
MNSEWLLSFSIACGFHGLVLFGFNFSIARPAQYGMSVGESCVEVNLVAAPVEIQAEEHPFPPNLGPREPIREADIPAPQSPPQLAIPSLPAPEKPPAKRSFSDKRCLARRDLPQPDPGDGSSDRSGRDTTTLQSDGGVATEARPDYLKNPPPSYPERARRLNQEGPVLLAVRVTSAGIPDSVEVDQSSGFPLLDAAAVQAVKKWRFNPARLGVIPVNSMVVVPIEFQLRKTSHSNDLNPGR